ncbi:Nucleolar MIF4G domain-containing protein 1 [Morella rubra]|uniref:Nucleolar MIF4G domain-containing protein 1 n=1 Tax=Morella rubra TaxID=262757 RepID=A0A6A1VM85_9ROSI|nr:Nucleolar MIF4G domain-containing protein 1 [Morella rubra]
MAYARTVKNVSPHEFVKGYSAQLKQCGKKSVRKTKFEAYIEMDMQNVVALAEEDLELERKLAKKLKVKDGKLRGEDDGINVLFRGIPSIIDSLGKEGTPSAKEFPDSSPKRKKRKEMMSLDQGLESEVAGDFGLGASESLETCDAYMLREIPAKSPSRMKHKKRKVLEQGQDGDTVADMAVGASRPAVSCVAEVVLEEVPAKSIARAAASQIVSEEILASCSGGMACLVGIDFSAKLMASLAECFELLLIVAFLVVLPSELIYEFLIMLSKRLTEIDVSTILTTLQCCGMKIRGDDPAAMKNFILSVQNRVNELKAFSGDGQQNINGKRMEFMLETICDIKNNKKRTKEDPAHHTRIKKWLQKLRVEDILIRGLKWSKLLDPEKKGQWWLSGDVVSTKDNVEEVASTMDREVLEAQKMLQLASEQRMNTDARRAIFCILMSGEDYIDTFEKLLRLDLQGKQAASKLCEHDKNHKFTLQFCLWDHFKEVESMQLIRSMHLARFVAEMVASFSLSLAVLKSVGLGDIKQLTPKRIMHFRMVFEALFEYSDKLIWNVFTRVAVTPELESLRHGTEFFIKEYVVKTNKAMTEKFKVAKRALKNTEGVLM